MKLLVGAGVSDDGYTMDVEIIDLIDPKNRCWNLESLPVKTERIIGSVMGSKDSKLPILCGVSNEVLNYHCITIAITRFQAEYV